MDAKDLILSDAIESAIEGHYRAQKLRRCVYILCTMNVALLIALVAVIVGG